MEVAVNKDSLPQLSDQEYNQGLSDVSHGHTETEAAQGYIAYDIARQALEKVTVNLA